MIRLPAALALSLLAAMQVFALAAAAQEASVYQVEDLHPGATDPDDALDLSSPRGALRSFLATIEIGDYKTAARALRRSARTDVPPPELARMLGEVIDRRLWIDGGGLPDRPDAMVESLGDNPRAGEARRSIALGTVEYERFPITIRLNRYQSGDTGPVWLFAEDTVAATPALYARHGPGWLESRLPAWWRERSALSVRHWEIAALPLLILCAAAIAGLISGSLGWLRKHVRPAWVAGAVTASTTPVALLAAAIFVQAVLNSALGFSGEITALLTPLLIAAIVIALVMAVLRVIDAGLDVVTRRYVGEIDDRIGRDDRHFYTSIYALRRGVALLAFLVGAGLIFWELGIFRNIGLSLLASAGVATVVLGIAAQTVLGNILASLQIAIAKPIRIGDSVSYEGQWCYVEAIFYTFIRLRTWDERRLLVPVKYFISHPFENWSMTDATTIETFTLVLDPMADTEALAAQFRRIAREDDDLRAEETLKMQVTGQDADGMQCRFYATAPDPTSGWNLKCRLRDAMLSWVRRTHPEWWPRERIVSAEGRPASTAED